ncbi:MAG TPA: dihydrodipicolinate synthase family protein [Solirubrobacteraceae bacterium]|nr:dihydrodipicolinate synthase family protein [Solirubrobacteraceae bacterium]
MRGVHPAIVTHFDGELNVDHDAVAAEVQRLIAGGVDGIVACGTMGEANSLSRSERSEVVRTAVAAVDGRVPVCVGVSAPSAEHAAGYARDAAAAGADGLMSLPPLLYRADRHELREYLAAVCAATDLPLMLYNNPEASGVDLEPELLADLTRELPAITSIKDSSGDARRIAELLGRCDGVDVLVGGDDWALEGACMGAAGWVAGVAVVLPERCVELWRLGVAGELDQARPLYAELLPLARYDMTAKLVQYFKAALDEIGIGGGPCRPPRLALTESELRSLREATALARRVAQR